MARKKTISLVTFGILVVALIWMFAYGLPWVIHAYTVSQLEHLTGQTVILDEVSLHYVDRTLTLQGLQVKTADGDRPLVALDHVQIYFRILPLWNKQVLLPRIVLDQPIVTLIRTPEGDLNVTQLLQKDPEASGEAGFEVRVKDFELRNGIMIYQDLTHPDHPRVQIDQIGLQISNFSAQSTEPIPIQFQAGLAEKGRITATGRMHLSPFSLESEWEVKEVNLSPYQNLMPAVPAFSGIFDSAFHLEIPVEDPSHVRVSGNAVFHHLQIGPPPSPFFSAQRLEVSDVKLNSPDQLFISKVLVEEIFLKILRDQEGNVPILAAFKKERPEETLQDEGQPGLTPVVENIQIQEGRITFIDQSIQPVYQKTVSAIRVNMDHLASGPDRPGHIRVTASTPEEESIAIEGDIRLFGRELFLNVDGTVKKLSVLTFNPYMEQFMGWGTQSGHLTTTFDIRIEEQRLDSKSKIGISDLRVVRAGTEDLVNQKLGLPLGLIVDLIKNIHGDIKLKIDVDGPLNKPEFSIRDAIWKSLRNAVVNIAAAPLRLIGSLVKRQSRIEKVDIHPVLFKAGTRTLQEGMEERIRHFQTFLADTPYIELTVIPVISQRDMHMLRIRNVASRIASLEARNPSYKGAKAAQALYREQFPQKEPPQEEVKLMRELVSVEPDPETQAKVLAGKRADLFVKKLTEAQGISAKRIHVGELRTASLNEAAGGLEFSITR